MDDDIIVEASKSIKEWIKENPDHVESMLDGVSHPFAMWVSDQVGGENSTRVIVYVLTTAAVLETAETVLNVGSGFTHMNVTGFTLHSIKNTVESI